MNKSKASLVLMVVSLIIMQGSDAGAQRKGQTSNWDATKAVGIGGTVGLLGAVCLASGPACPASVPIAGGILGTIGGTIALFPTPPNLGPFPNGPGNWPDAPGPGNFSAIGGSSSIWNGAGGFAPWGLAEVKVSTFKSVDAFRAPQFGSPKRNPLPPIVRGIKSIARQVDWKGSVVNITAQHFQNRR